MDIKKLIELGKMEVVFHVTGIGDMHFELPSSDEIKPGMDPYVLMAKHITKIDDQDFRSPEKQSELVATLPRVQPAVTAKISKICEDLLKSQNETIEGLFGKNL